MSLQLPITDPILQLTFLLAIALLVQLSLERVHIPGITGLLLVGMVLGPGGAGVIPREPVTELLGAVGLIFIMFLAGVEIDLDVASERRREVLTFGISAFLLSVLPALLLGRLLGLGWAGAVLLGAALSSHTLLAFPIIERLGIASRPAIVTAVGGTLLTDTAALVLLVITVQVAIANSAGGFEAAAFLPLVALAAIAAAALLFLPGLGRTFLDRADDRPAKALFILVVLLTLSVATDLIGTEDILGAFLAGVCLNRAVRDRPELHEHIAFVGRMLFIPFFFIATGMRLELGVLIGGSRVWLVAGLLLLVVIVGKASASALTALRYGFGRMAIASMVGLTLPQAAATLAVTVTAAEAGLMDPELVDSFIIVILLTCLAGPMLTRWSSERITRAGDTEPEPRDTDSQARREAP